VLDGVVYVNTLGGKLYALDADSGDTLWTATTGGYGDSAPAIFAGHVLVGAVSGLQAWPSDCGGACVPDWTAGTTTVNPSLTVVDGRVFAGEYSGFLRAYDLSTGAALWGAKVNVGDPVFGSPTVADGRVFVSGDLGLYAFAADGSSGSQPLWLRPTQYGCEESPAAVDGRVFVADDGGRVYAVDAASGALLWTAESSFLASSPAVADGRVFVTTGDARVFAFPSEASGHPAPLWTASLGPGKGLFNPVVANGVVWTGSIDTIYFEGTLYAFAADTGEQLAALPVDGAIECEPTVVDGRVYVSTLAGMVYAFELP
jgi:outer membrane protein assembly factor BamB